MRLTVKDLVLMSVLTSVLVIQNLIIGMIPYIQLTFLLLFLYSRLMGTGKTILMITVYVVIINIVMGTSIIPLQILGFSLVPLSLHFIKSDDPLLLSIMGGIISVIYLILMDTGYWLIASGGLYGLIAYIIVGLIFGVPVIASSILTILFLYEPVLFKLRHLKFGSKMEIVKDRENR